VLSVFSKKPVRIKAAAASIGIRGTGAYIEVDPGASTSASATAKRWSRARRWQSKR
jgi:hypothetical protein